MTPATQPVRGSILVTRGDTVLAQVDSGYADAATGTVNSRQTRYQIASISKQFTAAAVLLLAERGALALDDRVGRWIGGCPRSWEPITLHQLLVHSSGLGHWKDYPTIDLTAGMAPDDLIAVFHQAAPLFEPGTAWQYSSPGYVLLAHVVQRAADRPYREFLDDEIFTPMGMDRTFVGAPGDRTDVARGHAADKPVPSFELDSVGMGAGDAWSTVDDMRAWLDGLPAGRLLGPESLRLTFTEHAATIHGPELRSYGYGWFIGTVNGERWRQHSGDNAGFKAFAAWLPDSDRRLVILSNQDETGPAAVHDLLAATA
ncbi:serine hydrolase domain-containing protein [Micromonospora sp. NPDC049523]|uniref:serine hydrolase domain-containing protein n=1 Tax=Micromonospora sp. NPDC049523 TaxID=3155921 RepID=UPI003449CA66